MLRPREFHIFDLDGTVLNTRPVVEHCYAAAAKQLGVKLPKDYWGRPASEWKCSAALHTLKTAMYIQRILDGCVEHAWAWNAFVQLCCAPQAHVQIWTGASEVAVSTLALQFKLDVPMRSSLTVAAKTAALTGLRLMNRLTPIHYYDDDRAAAVKIVRYVPNAHLHQPPIRKEVTTCK